MNTGDYQPLHCLLVAQTMYAGPSQWTDDLSVMAPDTLARMSLVIYDWLHAGENEDADVVSIVYLETLQQLFPVVTAVLISKLTKDDIF